MDVRMPDGVVVRFPDDLSKEEIGALIREKYGDENGMMPTMQLKGKVADMAPYEPSGEVSSNIERPAEDRYLSALGNMREKYFSNLTDEQWAEAAKDPRFKPYDAGMLFGEGMRLGLGDEASGAAGALFGLTSGKDMGQAFKDFQEFEQARREYGAELSGGVGVAAEVGGSLLSGRPDVAVTRAAGFVPRVLQGAKEGTELGAVYGAASTEGNLTDRARGALVGAGTGAVVGAAAEPVVSGAGKLWSTLATNKAAKASGMTPQAARFLEETLSADDALSAAGRARIAQAGNEGMLADAGQSARNMLDFAIQSSGRAGKLAQERIGGRVSRDAQAINDALDRALGAPQGVQTTRQGIARGSQADRSQTYDAAYVSAIDYASPAGRELEELLTRVRKSDIDAANQMMREEGVRSNQIIANIADDGAVTFKTMPDVRQIDYITRALNDRAEASAGLGKLGGQTNAGRVTSGLSRSLRDKLKEAVPEYGTALATAADPIRRSKMVEFGAELLSARTTREDVAEAVAGITKAERDALAQGIRSSFDDMLANVTRTVMDGDVPAREAIKALKTLSSRAAREKMEMAIGKQASDDLFRELDRATKSFELRADVADNSKTFQRQEMNRRMEAAGDSDGLIASLGKGEPLQAAKRAVQAVTDRTPAAALREKDRLSLEVVNALTAPAGQSIRTARALRRLGSTKTKIERKTNALRSLFGAGGAALGGYSGADPEQRTVARRALGL